MIPFKDLPVEIQERMLDEQEKQGYPRNAEVFEKATSASPFEGGFLWAQSVEGFDFWNRIIENGDIAVFYKKYPKSYKNDSYDTI